MPFKFVLNKKMHNVKQTNLDVYVHEQPNKQQTWRMFEWKEAGFQVLYYKLGCT